MYDTSDIRKGLKIEIDGDPYTVVDFQFVKPGKGNAFTRCKIKNLATGAVMDRTYRSGEKLQECSLDERAMQYLYQDEEGFHFMDQQSYEQYALTPEMLGEEAKYLLENLEVTLLMHNGKPISMTLPIFVELQVVETEPGMKGDTVTGGRKPATMNTGAVINVPLFIDRGEFLKIDTRTGEYVERVK
ncbi:MAG: elongation factor P [SAR324 cluster bacterium]|nr:elongation factor P [SAR324 cluster bacterium]MCZ6558701.1 elongation factor P [SAR324 cluster bacterium]MCZ6629539.1 elongation factor P [SAR324 cluster bacterium]MCZ6646700.1 elongation factor P [SAR324 cluster bacterium]MCZ6730300.1 elongation factor P [SAR324 cluster bacterium]